MLSVHPAVITDIIRADVQVIEARAIAESETQERRVLAYPALSGGLAVGDAVLLNVTATTLSLGTGGSDFVVANLSQAAPMTFGDPEGDEHIIKLRYTPHQHAVRAVEMMPEHAGVWDRADSLRGTPVVVCELHSQVAAVCAGVKAARPDVRVVYVYTDTAALAIAFSRLVPQLKNAGLLDATITSGQAFGGDYEAVSVPSALIAADWIAGADVIIVGQGPGNAGTGTKYGWGGVETAAFCAIAAQLKGDTIFALRVSDADARGRHSGVSHHSRTVLETLATRTVTVAIPTEQADAFSREPSREAIQQRHHRFAEASGEPGLILLQERGIQVTTMGRSVEQDRTFFAFAAAAGAVAAAKLSPRLATPTPE